MDDERPEADERDDFGLVCMTLAIWRLVNQWAIGEINWVLAAGLGVYS